MFFFLENEKGAPPVGTTLYAVVEHLYSVPKHGCTFIGIEYVVFEGEIIEHLTGIKNLMRLVGHSPEGYVEVVYRSACDLGKTVFYTAREAAMLAKKKTEEYERRWAWTAKYGDVPLRRPWEKLLEEAI